VCSQPGRTYIVVVIVHWKIVFCCARGAAEEKVICLCDAFYRADFSDLLPSEMNSLAMIYVY